MTDSPPEIRINVRRIVEEKKKRPSAFFFRFLDWLVSYIPTHRDTAKGRKNALQMRALLIVCGVLIVGFAGRAWVIVGVLVMALALIAPMPEMRRRSLRSRLKRAQTRTVERREPAHIVFDGRRVMVLDQIDKSLIRVLTNKQNHEIRERNVGGRRAVVIKGPGSKKRDQIWLITDQPADSDLESTPASEIPTRLEASSPDVDKLIHATESA